MNNNLSNNLKKIRKEHHLSQEQLADELGVSRQAISKWESGIAYPEMEKILQICKKFNLNINDLLNNNISEVKSEQDSKNSLNKFIDDFLFYITKSVKMFSSFNFKTKIKCIIEQMVVFLILLCIFAVLGLTLSQIFRNLISFIPIDNRNILISIFETIYYVLALIFGIVIFFHIFKIRYLDYYEIVNEEKNIEKKEPEETSDLTLSEDNKSRIIIRDPQHSEYRFIKGMMKIFIGCVKLFSLIFILCAAFTLLTFVILLVCSFAIIKTGLFFIGIFLSLIGVIGINVIILLILLNFVFNRKNKKSRIIFCTIFNLIITGIGIGLICISILDFKTIDMNQPEFIKTNKFELSMKDNLVIQDYYNVKYVEKDIDNIIIEYKINKYFNLQYNLIGNNNFIVLNIWPKLESPIDVINSSIAHLNKKELLTADENIISLTIYTSAENIEQILNNNSNYNNYYQEIEYYQEQLNQYQEQNEQLEIENYELKNTIEEYQSIIDNYQSNSEMN